jgi:hypothetical protein
LAIERSLAHCGYHVGQIILIARILAGANWNTITMPRCGSATFNQRVWGSGSYQKATGDQEAKATDGGVAVENRWQSES